jgi:hypothetical protein
MKPPRLLPVLLVLALFACSAPGALPRHTERVPYPGPDTILLSRVADGSLTVDGCLDEWQELPAVYLCDQWHRLGGGPETADRALVRLACDSVNLYAAADVVDAEVVNTNDLRTLWSGDNVELFFDLRPAESPEMDMSLGDEFYMGPCYQIHVTPVAANGRAEARWFCPQKLEAGFPGLQAASALSDRGYVLEIAIPIASLDMGGPERLDSPLGFDVQIDDGVLTEEGLSEGRGWYAWQGQPGSYERPQNFGRTKTVPSGTAQPAVFSWVAGDRVHWMRGTGFVNGLAVRVDGANPAPELDLAFRFAGSDFDRPADSDLREVPEDGVRPDGEPVPERSWDDPAFGLRLYERRIAVEPQIGGRYYVEAGFRLGDEKQSMVRRFYCIEQKGSTDSRLVRTGYAQDDVLARLADDGALFLNSYCVLGDTPVTGRFYTPDLRWHFSEVALDPEKAFSVRVDASGRAGGPPTTLATGAVKLGSPELPLRTGDLADGAYVLRTSVVAPDGTERSVKSTYGTEASARMLHVCRERDNVLPATVSDAREMLTEAVPIGDPCRAQFPEDDEKHCFARNIWDLQFYHGRTYVGCGDWFDNQGPITIWSFGPAPAGQAEFTEELTVDDESVDVLRVVEDQLVVPGIDARENWELGNVYIKEGERWRKMRTVPNGIHVFDAAWFGGRLVVTTGTEHGAGLFASADWGESWQEYSADGTSGLGDGRYYMMAPLGDELLVLGGRLAEYACLFSGEALREIVAPFMPGTGGDWPAPRRVEAFDGRALYSILSLSVRSPLYVVADPQEGARRVSVFDDAWVQDIVVRDDVVYVLTSNKAADAFDGAVYASADITSWQRMARFSTPAVARSLELMDGVFYVGLGCAPRTVNPASGLVCRLE